MGVMETAEPTFQVKPWLLLETPSKAVTIVAYGPATEAPAAMVPEIRPVLGLMLKPVGRLSALKVTDSVLASVAVACREMLVPSPSRRSASAVTVIAEAMLQLKPWLALEVPSEAMTVGA